MIKQFYLCFRLSIFRSGACAGIALTGLMYSHAGIAQSVVTGQVISDDDRAPLAGVSVIEKGTNNGTVTDSNGKYQITVKGASSVLTFSFLGYVSHEVTVGGRAVADVTLFADSKQLSEVVVTALGIKKDVRKLGYAVQERIIPLRCLAHHHHRAGQEQEGDFLKQLMHWNRLSVLFTIKKRSSEFFLLIYPEIV